MGEAKKLVIQVDDEPLMMSMAIRREFRGLPGHQLRQVVVGDGSELARKWEDPVPVIIAALQAGHEVVLIFDANVCDDRGVKVNSACFVRALRDGLAALSEKPTGKVLAFIVWSDDPVAAATVLEAAKAGLEFSAYEVVGKGFQFAGQLKATLELFLD